MASLTLVGDELRLDGETVADLRPCAQGRNSLRGRIEAALQCANDADEAGLFAEPDDQIAVLKRSVRDALRMLGSGETAKGAERLRQALVA